MASLLADENVPLALVLALRALGHDVETALEAGIANQGTPDDRVLDHATQKGRAVLTNNRRDFHRLHLHSSAHAGIITFTDDRDTAALADRIHIRVEALSTLSGQLIRIVRPG